MNTKLIKKWSEKTIEDMGCYCSEEFKLFTRDFKKYLVNSLGEEYTVEGFKPNHYSFSGFVHKDGKYVYVSYDMPRRVPVNIFRQDCAGVLVRTARNESDYTGGPNTFTSLLLAPERIVNLIERQLKKEAV